MEPETTRYRKNEDLAFRLVAGEAVIVPVRGGVADLRCLFTLNEVGAAIWQLLEPEQSVASIVVRLTEEFNVSSEQARSDLDEFLEALSSRGLIEPVAEASP